MATNYQPNSGSGGYLKGAIVGGLIGAAAALLFAPKTGREMRSDLKLRAGDAYDVVKKQAGDLAVTAQSAAKTVGSQASSIASKVQEFTGSALKSNPQLADKAHEVVDTVSDKAHDYVNKAEDSASQSTRGGNSVTTFASTGQSGSMEGSGSPGSKSF